MKTLHHPVLKYEMKIAHIMFGKTSIQICKITPYTACEQALSGVGRQGGKKWREGSLSTDFPLRRH